MVLEVGHRNKIKNCMELFKYSVHFKLCINNGILTKNELRNMVRLTFSEQLSSDGSSGK